MSMKSWKVVDRLLLLLSAFDRQFELSKSHPALTIADRLLSIRSCSLVVPSRAHPTRPSGSSASFIRALLIQSDRPTRRTAASADRRFPGRSPGLQR